MKVSLDWLNDYVDLSGRKTSEIEVALTLIGFEVEGVEETGMPQMEQCVVGEVLSSEPHPNADRLSVCEVDTGEAEPHNIVCGARNYKVGDRVPVALPGCMLPGGFKIKKTKLRGVKSEGMMCSARELGLGEDHAGLLILEDKPAIGKPINEVFPGGDTIFDIEVTPNRPDCLSHLGIARELAAYFRLEFTYPEVKSSTSSPFRESSEPLLKEVRCDSERNCPYYSAYSMRDVKVGPSPEWLQARLRAIGLRPINNVVDVTNYVLHELGQPLHAFDAAKIGDNTIIVRQAEKGEKIAALDEKTYTLEPDHLVIADASKPIAIAGVMGGSETEVDENTSNVVLESAYFNPPNVRATAKNLGVSSDSSYRFERGVDPNGAQFAALRALDLIRECAGGEISGPEMVAGEPPLVQNEIRLEPDFVRRSFGFDISNDEIRKSLDALELDVSEHEEGDEETTEHGHTIKVFRVGVPTFRQDLERPIDLVEEVLRIHGTDKIPSTGVSNPGLAAEDDDMAVFVRGVSQMLAHRGFNECMHYPMRSEDELRQWYSNAAADNLGLANPLASDQSHLRTSVLPGLLDAVQLNLSRKNPVSRLFEVGRVFREYNGAIYEMVCVGAVLLDADEEAWRKAQPTDFYAASAVASLVLQEAGIEVDRDSFASIKAEDPWQAGHAAAFGSFDDGFEAKFGMLDLQMLKKWDIDTPVAAVAVNILPERLRKEHGRPAFQHISPFPPATRDIALVVDKDVSAGTVRSKLVTIGEEAASGFDLEDVRVFDVYEGKGIPEGHKSMAFTLSFRASDRTLKDKEVNKAFEAIQQKIVDHTGYSVRS